MVDMRSIHLIYPSVDVSLFPLTVARFGGPRRALDQDIAKILVSTVPNQLSHDLFGLRRLLFIHQRGFQKVARQYRDM